MTTARGQRSALVLLAFGVAAVAAHGAHAWVLVDACLHAGGRYVGDPPRCALAGNVVRDLGGLPRRPGWWLIVVAPAAVVGALTYVLGRALVRRAPGAGG